MRRLLVTKDRSAFARRHADVLKVPRRQRRKPAAIDGRFGSPRQLVKNSFQDFNMPVNTKIEADRQPDSWKTHVILPNPSGQLAPRALASREI